MLPLHLRHPSSHAVSSEACLTTKQRYHRKRRPPSLFEQRLVWDTFCSRHSGRSDFTRHIRMSHDSFNKLLSAIQQDLEVDREMAELWGDAILPEICLNIMCLRYLAGGSYLDIKYFTGISSASFYRVLWKTMRAINQSKSEFSVHQISCYNC